MPGADVKLPNVDEQGVDVVDPQVDPQTGHPVEVPPDGSLENTREDVVDGPVPDDQPRIDPNSRIPRPVQPDLA